MRSYAGTPGGLDDRPMLRPETWHLHAIFEVIRLFVVMVKLADLDLFLEETVMGHVQYTLNAMIGKESRLMLLADLDELPNGQ